MRHFAIFGTHPRLSLAELKAVAPALPAPILCGAAAIFETNAWDAARLMAQLGGTVKVGDVVDEMPLAEVDGDGLVKILLDHPRGDRVLFGLSAHGGNAGQRKRLQKLGIELKRALKATGRSARWVTSDNQEALSPAAVAKLKLTNEGYDLVLLAHDATVAIGLTTHVQDADAWSLRDFGRPVRDDENGMLPPKLARMMVNLASVPEGGALLDPFCGSGTILMEAALATKAAKIMGSDIEAKQVDDTRLNINWLISHGILAAEDKERVTLTAADARKFSFPKKLDAVITEGTLGPPLRGSESQAQLDRTQKEITRIWEETLDNLAGALTSRARLVCIWPAYKTAHGTTRVDLTDWIKKDGRFELVDLLTNWDNTRGPLLYYREGQRVMRRIVALERAK